MPPHWYRVQTICAATIRETWTIRSDVPLTYDGIADALEARGSNVVNLEDETRVTEADRSIIQIARLPGDPLRPTH